MARGMRGCHSWTLMRSSAAREGGTAWLDKRALPNRVAHLSKRFLASLPRNAADDVGDVARRGARSGGSWLPSDMLAGHPALPQRAHASFVRWGTFSARRGASRCGCQAPMRAAPSARAKISPIDALHRWAILPGERVVRMCSLTLDLAYSSWHVHVEELLTTSCSEERYSGKRVRLRERRCPRRIVLDKEECKLHLHNSQ